MRKEVDRTEVSLWLELTRWFKYLDGHLLYDTVKLANLPRARTESLLGVDTVVRLPESHVKTIRPPYSSVFTTCSIVSLMISSTQSRASCIHVSASRDSDTLFNAWTLLHNTID
jgi:hypothetical protein